MRRRLSDLTIKDAFMFAAVMSDEKQCRRFLEIALEMKILEVHPIAEKAFHSIRTIVAFGWMFLLKNRGLSENLTLRCK